MFPLKQGAVSIVMHTARYYHDAWFNTKLTSLFDVISTSSKSSSNTSIVTYLCYIAREKGFYMAYWLIHVRFDFVVKMSLPARWSQFGNFTGKVDADAVKYIAEISENTLLGLREREFSS